MSRIGKKSIEIPNGVEATLKQGTIEVKGALGARHFDFSEKLNVDYFNANLNIKGIGLESNDLDLIIDGSLYVFVHAATKWSEEALEAE